MIDREEAIRIAESDARLKYSDLAIYDVSATLFQDEWKIDYILRDKISQGGGPHYVISSDTGEILSKRYEQ